MSKKKISIAIIVLLLIGGGYYYFSHRSTGEVVETEVVKRGDVAETVSVTGELVPEEYADLSFSSVGTIDAVMVKIGDNVAEGQTIASLDREVLFSQLKDARIAAAIAVQNEQLYLRNKNDYDPEERHAKKLASEQAAKQGRHEEINAARKAGLLASLMG